jgi:hypothetical protein
MLFDNFKATLNSKKRRRASAVIPYIQYEDTPEPEIVQNILKPSRSLRSILIPSLPRFKPITISNFTAISGPSATTMCTVAKDAELSDSAGLQTPFHSDQSSPEPPQKMQSRTIKRKPVGSASSDPRRLSYIPKFDPQAPRQDASLHNKAKEALKKRYQSKFTFDFEPHEGANKRDYDFLWVKTGELDMKILDDIIWVRERFAHARKEEPTDDEIIWWYDAGRFDEGNWPLNAQNKGSLTNSMVLES